MGQISKEAHQFLKGLIYEPPAVDEEADLIIKNEVISKKPSMIARFGSTEIKAVLYPRMPFAMRWAMRKSVFDHMEICSGFFPAEEKTIKLFSELMVKDMELLDVLGSWRVEECLLAKDFPSAKRVELKALEPYLSRDPWSAALKGKKILVVHPFSETIKEQYRNKRQKLFLDNRVLPEFKQLDVIKAVQTIAGNRGDFKDWFAALECQKEQISKKDFDIAIIGCGAYGFPLAAHVKRMGKKAVHMGGAAQILFGIKGRRWLENERFKNIINEQFVFPSEQEKPANSEKVEKSCYW